MSNWTAEKILILLKESPPSNFDRAIFRWRNIQDILAQAPTGRIIGALHESGRLFTKWLLCYLLGERADADAIPSLRDLAQHPNRRIRSQAQEALVKLEHYQKHVLHSEEIVRAVESSFGSSSDPLYDLKVRATTQNVLLALERSENPRTRQYLCRVLGYKQDDIALPTLIKVLHDGDRQTQLAAADAISQIDPLNNPLEVIPSINLDDHNNLVRLLEDENPIARGIAAWILGLFHVREAKGAIERALMTESNVYSVAYMEEALRKL